MARNEEKHAGRLNRLWLQKLDEEQEKRNPARPGLGSLKTASDVQKWIPSIKKDIDFYLKQSQVTCFPDRQIKEFSSKIESLTKEYKAYIRKLKELQPLQVDVPWTDRRYTRKHKIDPLGLEDKADTADFKDRTKSPKKSCTEFTPLSTPLLDNDSNFDQMYGYKNDVLSSVTDNKEDEIEPVDCRREFTQMTAFPSLVEIGNERSNSYGNSHDKPHLSIRVISQTAQNLPFEFEWTHQKDNMNNADDCDHGLLTHTKVDQQNNVLNLPYSDSSDDEN